jgi:glucose-1-phosphate cytidylyltransferase
VSDINIAHLVQFHKSQNTIVTLTAVQQPGRFGAFNLLTDSNKINQFQEKPMNTDTPWINGGFFVCEPSVLDLISDDSCVWEKEPLEVMARAGQLSAYRHTGFWQPMDTLRDKYFLEDLWRAGNAPWKIWDKNMSRFFAGELQQNALTFA